MSRTQTIVQEPAIPLLLRIVYFFLFGLWATAIWVAIAWILNVTIVGLPVGLWMLHRVPQVLTLKPAREMVVAYERPGGVELRKAGIAQRPWPVRLIYFVLIGWWLSLVWSILAWVVCITVVGLPLGIWMFNRVPALTTLLES